MSGPDTRPAPAAEEALPEPARVPREGWRARVRARPGMGLLYRGGVFLLGLAFIVLGFGLVVLPGPLTIPPILLGLWIWSTEFRFAQRFFESFKVKAREAWNHAKLHPVSSTLVTVGGIVGAIAVVWAVTHFDLVTRARDVVGV